MQNLIRKMFPFSNLFQGSFQQGDCLTCFLKVGPGLVGLYLCCPNPHPLMSPLLPPPPPASFSVLVLCDNLLRNSSYGMRFDMGTTWQYLYSIWKERPFFWEGQRQRVCGSLIRQGKERVEARDGAELCICQRKPFDLSLHSTGKQKRVGRLRFHSTMW